MTLYKVLKYIALAIGVIGIILLGRIIFTGDEAIKNSADLQASMLNPIMWVGYIIFAITIVLVAIFVIKEIFTGNIKNTLIAVGAFAIIIVVSYVVTTGHPVELEDGTTLSANADHWVGAGLWVFYIMAVLAILTMIFTGIRKLTK